MTAFHGLVPTPCRLGVCVPFLRTVAVAAAAAAAVLATIGSAIRDEHEASGRSHRSCVDERARPVRKDMVGDDLEAGFSPSWFTTMASDVLTEELEVGFSIEKKQTFTDVFAFPGARIHLWRRSH